MVYSTWQNKYRKETQSLNLNAYQLSILNRTFAVQQTSSTDTVYTCIKPLSLWLIKLNSCFYLGIRLGVGYITRSFCTEHVVIKNLKVNLAIILAGDLQFKYLRKRTLQAFTRFEAVPHRVGVSTNRATWSHVGSRVEWELTSCGVIWILFGKARIYVTFWDNNKLLLKIKILCVFYTILFYTTSETSARIPSSFQTRENISTHEAAGRVVLLFSNV